MLPRHSRPTGPFARFAHLFSAPVTAGRKPRRRRSLAAHRALRLESLESRAMLSSAPFIASLPQDLAGKTASLVTVHGRYGNNALNGDWELGVTTNASAPPQHHINRTWAKGTKEPFTISFTSRRPRARSSRSVASGPRCSSRCPPARDIVRATAMALTVQSNGIVSADDGRLWVYAGVSDATRSDCWAMLRSSPIQTGRPWLTCLCPTIAPVGQSLAGMW